MKVYLDYTQKELDRQYEHREWVPDADALIDAQREESQRVRANARGRFDVAYGDSEDELLDIYLADEATCGGRPAPMVAFFHGGRWAMGSKASNCAPAAMYAALGIHFVSINFSLLPAVTMDVLIGQCRDAIAWLARNSESFGGDARRLYVHGKSSGAHVAAMMAVTDWRDAYDLPADTVKGGLLASGMYDLEPVRLTFRNEWLKLDAAGAARNSPIRHVPDVGCPLIVAVGSEETDEFRRQAAAFAEAWRAKGLDMRLEVLEGRHHFTVDEDMGDPESPILQPFLDWMDLKTPAAG